MKTCNCTENELIYCCFKKNFADILSNVAYFYWNFQSTYFTGNFSVTAYDSSAIVLRKGLCNVIQHACRNCWRIWWIDSVNAFIYDIPPKIIKRH